METQSILCVDDEAIILLALKSSLQYHFGSRFSYEIASSADEALKIMEELTQEGMQVALVISDWQMPGMKGDEFLVLIRKMYPLTASIMITGQAEEDAKHRVLEEAKASKILDKPWNSKELFGLIERLCPKI